MKNKTSEIVMEAMKKAKAKDMVQELIVFMSGLSRLEQMELFGVATLLKVPLSKGTAKVDTEATKRLRQAGLGEEFDFLMERNDLKGMDQLLVEIFDAFILASPECQRNLCTLIHEAQGDD